MEAVPKPCRRLSRIAGTHAAGLSDADIMKVARTTAELKPCVQLSRIIFIWCKPASALRTSSRLRRTTEAPIPGDGRHQQPGPHAEWLERGRDRQESRQTMAAQAMIDYRRKRQCAAIVCRDLDDLGRVKPFCMRARLLMTTVSRDRAPPSFAAILTMSATLKPACTK